MEHEELEDAEDDVVNVAEPRGLTLLSAVEASCPVDGDVGIRMVEIDGSVDASRIEDWPKGKKLSNIGQSSSMLKRLMAHESRTPS
jgi:hypothetical protein